MLPRLPSDTSFHPDRAPPHYSLEVCLFLNEKLPNLWIERGGPARWPPRSSDLTSLGIFYGDT